MQTIKVNLAERSYTICVGAPLKKIGRAVQSAFAARSFTPAKALIVSHPRLFSRYGKEIVRSLERSGMECSFLLLPQGESNKTLESVEEIYEKCVRAGLDRSSCIVALGGGVIGDVAGFAAATYLRGISVIHAPTTLLAMVDSSIGGKTGVDLPEAKNFVGAFHQPALVWADTALLRTLPARQFRSGLAEVVKYGVIRDATLFRILEKRLPELLQKKEPLLSRVIARSARIKAEVVSKDERETKGLREILNFGHTWGHAIETAGGYDAFLHGEAISIGMCAAGFMSWSLGLFKADDLERMERLLAAAGLPTRLELKFDRAPLFNILVRDKKNRAGNLRFVLPVRIGKVVVRSVPPALALKGLDYVQKLGR